MRFAILLFVFSVPVFSDAKNARYVFSLMDSNFVVKARIDTHIQSSRDPDPAEIKKTANSVSRWNNVRLNSHPMGDVWLAYEPPSDPGTVVFVSNTTPPYPLLTLYIDAMCFGCFHEYSLFGTASVTVDAGTEGKKPIIVPLENDFQLGIPFNDEERVKIAGKLDDSALSGPGADSVQVHVVKWQSVFPSKDGIRYIAYFSFVDPTTSIPQSAARIRQKGIPQIMFDALGRSPKRFPPSLLREWRTY